MSSGSNETVVPIVPSLPAPPVTGTLHAHVPGQSCRSGPSNPKSVIAASQQQSTRLATGSVPRRRVLVEGGMDPDRHHAAHGPGRIHHHDPGVVAPDLDPA